MQLAKRCQSDTQGSQMMIYKIVRPDDFGLQAIKRFMDLCLPPFLSLRRQLITFS